MQTGSPSISLCVDGGDSPGDDNSVDSVPADPDDQIRSMLGVASTLAKVCAARIMVASLVSDSAVIVVGKVLYEQQIF